MSVRPQAHDIIRTWAFYTILRCTLLTDEKPFENVMMGGFILSEDGTPMHASLGNVIDPLKVIDEFGSDAFRCYAASCALGEDNPFRKKDVVRGVKLLRKLWNVHQFIDKIIPEKKPNKPVLQDIDQWILTKYSRLVKKCTQQMDVFDYSQSMKDIEYFLWHELADHYLEMVKDSIYRKKNLQSIQYTLYTVGLGILKLFAPFLPHITEEIFQLCYQKHEGDQSIHISSWPEAVLLDEEKEKAGEMVKNYISQVRSWKSEQGIALNSPLLSSATYASKNVISKLQPSKSIILSTLKYPPEHQFVIGKPSVEESIVEVRPVYAKIGPFFKQDGKKVVQWLKEHQETIIRKIKDNGDLSLSDIPVVHSNSTKGLIESGFINVKKETRIQGKKEGVILAFDSFYLEVRGKGA
jgi:valyl-tRNA synthetase